MNQLQRACGYQNVTVQRVKLASTQLVVIPVSEAAAMYVTPVRDRFLEAGFQAELDTCEESLESVSAMPKNAPSAHAKMHASRACIFATT